MWWDRAVLPAVELLFKARLALERVTDQEAVVRERIIFSLQQGSDIPFHVAECGHGYSRGGDAGHERLVAPGDGILRPGVRKLPGLQGAADRRRTCIQAQRSRLYHTAYRHVRQVEPYQAA